MTWQLLGTPYLLGAVSVETLTGQATLTVAAGAVLLMGKGQSLLVDRNGGLQLASSASAPVTVSSQASPAAPGDWGHIDFAAGSLAANNTLGYAAISYGGGSSSYGGPGGSVTLEVGAGATMLTLAAGTTLRLATGVGISIHGQGQLVAQGTPTQRVVFTANNQLQS